MASLTKVRRILKLVCMTCKETWEAPMLLPCMKCLDMDMVCYESKRFEFEAINNDGGVETISIDENDLMRLKFPWWEDEAA